MERRKTKSGPAGAAVQRQGMLRWGARNASLYGLWASILALFGYRQMILSVLDALPAEGRLIDLGCGSGEALRFVRARRPDLEAVAVDLSPAFLREAGRAHPRALRFACDIESIPCRPGEFHAVLCLGVLGHLLDAGPAIGEIRRLAASGARIHIWTRGDGFGSRLVARVFEWTNPGVRFVLHDPDRIRSLLRAEGIVEVRERRGAGGILWSGRAPDAGA